MATEMKISIFNIVIFIIAVIAVSGIIKFTSSGTTEFTGFGASLATIRMNMSPTLDITLTDANITFGPGFVTAGMSAAAIETTGKSPDNGSWGIVNDPFMLENTGNILANVSVNASKTATDWLGGSIVTPTFQYNYTNNEANSCLKDGTWANSSWSSAATNTRINMCQILNYTDANDAVRFDFRLVIPSDAEYGYKVNSFTFSAVQSS